MFDQEIEFVHVFGDIRDPFMRTYYENLLDIVRSRYTHDQIMANEYVMPTGYGPGDIIATMVRVIAAITAYVPVFGTAIAFVLNVATSIAQGESIDNVLLDGVGGALPGQPASRMAFDAVRAVAYGREIDEILIGAAASAAGLGDEGKKYIITAAKIARSIAEGEALDSVALDTLYDQLPPEGQRAMTVARRVINGEDIGNVAMSEAAAEAVAEGQDAVNNFITAAGYQGIVKTLPEDISRAITSGVVLGTAQRLQGGWEFGIPIGPRHSVGRVDTSAANDDLARIGQFYAKSNRLTGQAREMGQFGIQRVTNDEWRRGFDIGTAVAKGKTTNDVAQDDVRKTMKSISEYNGFDAGRSVQYKITLQPPEDPMSSFRVVANTATQEAQNLKLGGQGLILATSNPQVAAARALNSDPRYKYGYDIGTATALGSDSNGPWQSTVRASIGTGRVPGPGASPQFVASGGGSQQALEGFDTATQLQYGITRSGIVLSTHPAVAAGQLVTGGMIGTGTTEEQRVNAARSLTNNAATRAGAESVIKKQGFFAKLLAFFGL